MNTLFRAAANAITTAVSLGVFVCAAKYGFDAYHGDYCFPANKHSGALRVVTALGNDVANLGAGVLGKKLCPRTPVFVAPGG